MPPIQVAARFLGLRDRLPPAAWMFVSCECRVLYGRDLCESLAKGCPTESVCVTECAQAQK